MEVEKVLYPLRTSPYFSMFFYDRDCLVVVTSSPPGHCRSFFVCSLVFYRTRHSFHFFPSVCPRKYIMSHVPPPEKFQLDKFDIP
jgi:hypothetical protein